MPSNQGVVADLVQGCPCEGTLCRPCAIGALEEHLQVPVAAADHEIQSAVAVDITHGWRGVRGLVGQRAITLPWFRSRAAALRPLYSHTRPSAAPRTRSSLPSPFTSATLGAAGPPGSCSAFPPASTAAGGANLPLASCGSSRTAPDSSATTRSVRPSPFTSAA